MQFWIDELSSRRTENVLRRIADATDENAGQVAQMTMLVEQGAEQTTEMVGLNRTMVTLTRRVFWLTAASVVLAVTAVIVALIALASSGDESGDESGDRALISAPVRQYGQGPALPVSVVSGPASWSC